MILLYFMFILILNYVQEINIKSLGRFAIHTDRAVVLLCHDKPEYPKSHEELIAKRRKEDPILLPNYYPKKIHLSDTTCDGRGRVIIALHDINDLSKQTTLLTGSELFRGKYEFPNVILRHSFSRHGIFIVSTSYNLRHNGFQCDYSDFLIYGYPMSLIEGINRKMRNELGVENPLVDPMGDLRESENYVEIAFLYPFPDVGMANPRGKDGTAYYDVFVDNYGNSELIVGQSDGSVNCQQASVLPYRRRAFPNTWKRLFSVPGDITGPFAVVPHGKSRYLVLDSGNVVKICDNGKPLTKMETVFDKSRVLAVVHDTDEEKRYAFTATHYFEVAEPFVLKPHAVKKIDTTNGAKGLESAFHCARAIRGLPPIEYPVVKK